MVCELNNFQKSRDDLINVYINFLLERALSKIEQNDGSRCERMDMEVTSNLVRQRLDQCCSKGWHDYYFG